MDEVFPGRDAGALAAGPAAEPSAGGDDFDEPQPASELQPAASATMSILRIVDTLRRELGRR
jgi:hypothetical protein